MREMKVAQLWLLAAFILVFIGCASYETKVVPFKLPTAYSNAVELAGATIAAKDFSNKKEAEENFGFDIIGAGVIPVQLIFDNQGNNFIEIVAEQTFLVDTESNLWKVMDAKLAYDRIQKKTELGEAKSGALKYGGLGGLAGGLLGAAIGIVSGQPVGDAAVKGAALGAAAGATIGGAQGLDDPEVRHKIRSDLDSRSLESRAIKPHELAYGFIFFPGEAKGATELRIQIRDARIGTIYPLKMKLGKTAG
ncbi:MAG: hypothetical protein ABSB79_09140 [Syntrophales bacterium]